MKICLRTVKKRNEQQADPIFLKFLVGNIHKYLKISFFHCSLIKIKYIKMCSMCPVNKWGLAIIAGKKCSLFKKLSKHSLLGHSYFTREIMRISNWCILHSCAVLQIYYIFLLFSCCNSCLILLLFFWCENSN